MPWIILIHCDYYIMVYTLLPGFLFCSHVHCWDVASQISWCHKFLNIAIYEMISFRNISFIKFLDFIQTLWSQLNLQFTVQEKQWITVEVHENKLKNIAFKPSSMQQPMTLIPWNISCACQWTYLIKQFNQYTQCHIVIDLSILLTPSMDVWWPEHIIKVDFFYIRDFLAIKSETDVFNLTNNSCDNKVCKKQLDGPNSQGT